MQLGIAAQTSTTGTTATVSLSALTQLGLALFDANALPVFAVSIDVNLLSMRIYQMCAKCVTQIPIACEVRIHVCERRERERERDPVCACI